MDISRRSLFGVGVAVVAVGAAAVAAARPSRQALPIGRIDTHHHFLPDVYVQAYGPERLAASNPRGQVPEWSPEIALRTCDEMGIAKAIVSISPGFGAVLPSARNDIIRRCNEIAARLVIDHPARFGQFASINMSQPAEALAEIDHALVALKADGVVVFTNYDGRYLGDPQFDEIWQELNRRKAIVFIHPTSPGYQLIGQPTESAMEFPFDSTRTAVSLVLSGATRRFPDIKFILSHAGGTLPFLVDRIAGGALLNPKLRERLPDPMAEFRKFWFDTAISGNPAALSALFTLADPKRILFGSDFPFAPDQIIQANSAGVDRYPMKTAVRRAILHDNAAALLKRT